MQLRKMMMVLTALGAMSGFMVGCGDDDKGSDTCTTKADCAGKDPKSTDLICSNLDRVCVTKCSSNADCGTGRTCNTGSGQCEQGGGGNTDGTCTGEGRSTCAYGQFCSNSTCTPAPVAPGSCEGFAFSRPSWDPASSTGPVIYQLSRVRYEVGYRSCNHPNSGMPDAFIVSVRAYRADADWPALPGWPWFFYANGINNGTNNHHINVFRYNYAGVVWENGWKYQRNPANFKDAEFEFFLCRSPNSPSIIQAGFFFEQGNPVCLDLAR